MRVARDAALEHAAAVAEIGDEADAVAGEPALLDAAGLAGGAA